MDVIDKGQAGKIKFSGIKALHIRQKQQKEYETHPRKQIYCPCGFSRTIDWLYKCYYCGIYFCMLCAEDHFRNDSLMKVLIKMFRFNMGFLLGSAFGVLMMIVIIVLGDIA